MAVGSLSPTIVGRSLFNSCKSYLPYLLFLYPTTLDYVVPLEEIYPSTPLVPS